MGLVIVFVVSSFKFDQLVVVFEDGFVLVMVIGCIMVGEIGLVGYFVEGLFGVSIYCDDIIFEVGLLDFLFYFEIDVGWKFVQILKDVFYWCVFDLVFENMFVFMLIDGFCGCEEVVSRVFYDGLGGIVLIGGLVGDNQVFVEIWILYDGYFVSDVVFLLVVVMFFFFDVFKIQYFVSGKE